MSTNGRTEIRVTCFEDVVDRILRFDSFQVGERIYSAELLIPQLTVRTADLLGEAATCAAFIVYWGVESARARRFHSMQEAAYRSWRDRVWLEVKQGGEEGAKSPSDATCERLYRQRSEYGEWQRRIAATEEAASCAEAVLEAFRAKAQLIRSSEQILRDEASGPYYVVEDQRTTPPRQPKFEESGS